MHTLACLTRGIRDEMGIERQLDSNSILFRVFHVGLQNQIWKQQIPYVGLVAATFDRS